MQRTALPCSNCDSSFNVPRLWDECFTSQRGPIYPTTLRPGRVFIISNAADFGRFCFDYELNSREDLYGLQAETSATKLLTITVGANVFDNIGNTGTASTTTLYVQGAATTVGTIEAFGGRVKFTLDFPAAQTDESDIIVRFFARTRQEPVVIRAGATYLNNPCVPAGEDFAASCQFFGGPICKPDVCGGDRPGIYVNGDLVATISETGRAVAVTSSTRTATFSPVFTANATYTAIVIDGVTYIISIEANGADAAARVAALVLGLNALEQVGGGFVVGAGNTVVYTGPLSITRLTVGAGPTNYDAVVTNLRFLTINGGVSVTPRDCDCEANFGLYIFLSGVTCSDVVEYRNGVEVVKLGPGTAGCSYIWDLDGAGYTADDVVLLTGIIVNGVNLLGSTQTLTGTTLDAIGQEIANIIVAAGVVPVVYNTTSNTLTTDLTAFVFGAITGSTGADLANQVAFTLQPTQSC